MHEVDWTQYWMNLADAVATKSKCDRRQVGAIIVGKDGRKIVSTGYNGAPKGFPEPAGATCRSFCPRASESVLDTSYKNCVSCHAELNCILSGDSTKYDGATIFVTTAMCWDCAKVIANSGITTVVMRVLPEDQHREPQKTIEFLEMCSLKVIVIESE